MAAKNREESLKQNSQGSNAASQKTKHLSLCHFKSPCSDEDTEEAIEYIVIDQFQRKFGSALLPDLCNGLSVLVININQRTQIFTFHPMENTDLPRQ
ncbi:UNVERIFIED_CONTAM: hypothetical protein K2H54_048769 [Gekko kuhli]